VITQTTVVLEKKREHGSCEGARTGIIPTLMVMAVVLDPVVVSVDLVSKLLKEIKVNGNHKEEGAVRMGMRET